MPRGRPMITQSAVEKWLETQKCKLIGKYHGALEELYYEYEGLQFNSTWNHLFNEHKKPHESISVNEKRFMRFMTDNGILYKMQHTYDDLKDKSALRFDFLLTDYEILVEIDDLQGHKYNSAIIKHDLMKETYCKDHKLKLLRLTDDFEFDSSLVDWIDECAMADNVYLFHHGALYEKCPAMN
jgi:hypothetical protein